jgi:hypothetical protein
MAIEQKMSQGQIERSGLRKSRRNDANADDNGPATNWACARRCRPEVRMCPQNGYPKSAEWQNFGPDTVFTKMEGITILG